MRFSYMEMAVTDVTDKWTQARRGWLQSGVDGELTKQVAPGEVVVSSGQTGQ